MTNHYAICLLITFLVPFASCLDKDDDTRDDKLISTFQVVRFPNDGCTGSNSRNGTCYTSQECSNKGGSSSGSCADGFGVCCTFIITTCGSSSSENLTAWTQPASIDSDQYVCSLNVIPVSDDICSLRLDFTTFVISGPSTLTVVQGRRRFGNPTDNAADAYALEGNNWSTNCLTDAFYAQGSSPSSNPPVVCGVLTGSHMYVEADVDRGNKLMFTFSDMATVAVSISRGITALATRGWDITISHIECSSLTLPPNGCTKYFWNAAGRATLNNYNWATADSLGSVHLGQQHERMCIRRERGKCVGCFAAAANDFDVSMGRAGANTGHFTTANGCCGYTTWAGVDALTAADSLANGHWNAGGGQMGWDCVIIPGAFFMTSDAEGAHVAAQTTALMQGVIGDAAEMNVPQGPQICGAEAGIGPGMDNLVIMTQLIARAEEYSLGLDVGGLSVCTRNVPFTLEFMSDDLEGLGNNADDTEFLEATNSWNQGFNIVHTQLDC